MSTRESVYQDIFGFRRPFPEHVAALPASHISSLDALALLDDNIDELLFKQQRVQSYVVGDADIVPVPDQLSPVGSHNPTPTRPRFNSDFASHFVTSHINNNVTPTTNNNVTSSATKTFATQNIPPIVTSGTQTPPEKGSHSPATSSASRWTSERSSILTRSPSQAFGLFRGKSMDSRVQKTSSGRVLPQKEIERSVSHGTIGLGFRNASVSSKTSMARRVASSASLGSGVTVVTTGSRRPQVYPAMLSRVATLLKKSIVVGDLKKDGLVYRDAFTGQAAVDMICQIIRLSDRNLALLLGRALDAQNLFHDVVYEHRLRDSPYEVYEFSAHVYDGSVASQLTDGSSATLNTITEQPVDVVTHSVNGVFSLLAHCYSPTCTRDKLCYSISCPRRLEQQARLNLQPSGLKRNVSVVAMDDEEEKFLWTSTVPEALLEGMPKKEIKRQEAIYEFVTTERKFVKNLEHVKEYCIKPLSETNILPSEIRRNFIKHVFGNINDIYSVHRRFLDVLADRQKGKQCVSGIGDVILKFIPFFEPFIAYGASRPYAKYLIETQRSMNALFARFDEELIKGPAGQGIDSLLSQGFTRPGRYQLLVKELLKATDDKHDAREHENLQRSMDALNDFMKRLDKEIGGAQDRHDVKLLKQKILFKGEYVNLGLNSEKRRIKHEGVLSRKDRESDIQFYLLDHMLLFLKAKTADKMGRHKAFQRPIPLQLLFAVAGEDLPPLKRFLGKPGASSCVIESEFHNPKFAITFCYYGSKNHYTMTLYAAQLATMQTLLEKIRVEQARLVAENDIFSVSVVSDKFFTVGNRINSVVPCDGGRKLLFGTNQGVFVSDIKRDGQTVIFSTPTKLIGKPNVTQIAVLDEFQAVLVLADRKLYTCPISILHESGDTVSFFKRHSKELINHVNFFAEGDCDGKKLICTAHNHSIKYFEHEHPLLGNSKKSFKKSITEVDLDSDPVSISFLKANLCIGCKKGFQIVSVSKREHEPLLDAADTSLQFAMREQLKPLNIYRVGNMFLLCYAEFAFFVNNQGWKKKESSVIMWEGEPQSFALWSQYVLAFDSSFIEIREIDSGELVRVIVGTNIRFLHSSSQEVLYAYEDERGYDVVASIDFWSKA